MGPSVGWLEIELSARLLRDFLEWLLARMSNAPFLDQVQRPLWSVEHLVRLPCFGEWQMHEKGS
jgi:hypothetical protein